MVLKLINATEARVGSVINIQGAPCIVKKMDVSKTGKHGHAKVRFEAVGVIDGKKRVVVVPGHERFEVPMIEKKRGQILSKAGDKFSLMDSESYETFEMPAVSELELKDGDQVEYWNVEGERIIKRKN